MPDTEAAVERIMVTMLDCLTFEGGMTVEDVRLREAIREGLAAAQRDGYVRALGRFTMDERYAALRREAEEVADWARNDPVLAERVRQFYAEAEARADG